MYVCILHQLSTILTDNCLSVICFSILVYILTVFPISTIIYFSTLLSMYVYYTTIFLHSLLYNVFSNHDIIVLNLSNISCQICLIYFLVLIFFFKTCDTVYRLIYGFDTILNNVTQFIMHE